MVARLTRSSPLAVCCLLAHLAIANPDTHLDGVELARQGNTASAIQILSALYEQEPSQALVHDLIAIAHWHLDDGLALHWAEQLDDSSVPPDYTLHALARSYRNLGHFERALQTYGQCRQRWPADRDCQLGEALVLAEQGQHLAALAAINTMLAAEPEAADLYAYRGYIYRQSELWLQAADDYRQAAEYAPADSQYRQLQIVSLLDLGAVVQAGQLAESYPASVDQPLRERLAGDLAARHINWIDLPNREPALRQVRIDRAHQSLTEARAVSESPERQKFDYLLLADRERRPETVLAMAATMRGADAGESENSGENQDGSESEDAGGGQGEFDVLANDSDPDVDVLTLTNDEVIESVGSLSIVDGKIVFNPDDSHNSLAEGETANVTVSYTVQDPSGKTSTAELTITVTGTNDIPEVILTGNSVEENSAGGTVIGDLSAIDPDLTDTHSFEIVGDSPFEIVDDQLVVADGAVIDYEANSSIEVEVQVTDNNGGSSTKTFTINVEDINEGPQANAVTGVATEGAGAIAFDVLANDVDPDGDSLTLINVQVTKSTGSVPIVGGKVVFNPDDSHNSLAEGETADVTVSYTVQDLEEGIELPDYVLEVIAGAHLQLREPEQALKVIDAMSATAVSSFNVQVMRLYALEESGHYTEAVAVADALMAREPEWRYFPGLLEPERNNARFRAERLAAMMRAYGNRLAEAEERLDPLVDGAPLSAEARADRAAVYQWRGWPQAATQEYLINLSHTPEHPDSHLGLANLYAQRGQFAQAEQHWQALQPLADTQRMVRARESFDRQHGWALDQRFGHTESTGNTQGDREFRSSTELRSPVFGEGWRGYLGSDYQRADFPEGSGRERVDRLGVNRRQPQFEWYAGAHRAHFNDNGNGLHGGLRWLPDDHWYMGLALATNAPETPLRGRNQDVGADRVELSGGWRASESRRID
ncbi:MAG TPA: Ig-like domain-containing protein, partial [Marinobacter sp.]|nr:Ig-like domain-containing protein [Marinobacter sp.]